MSDYVWLWIAGIIVLITSGIQLIYQIDLDLEELALAIVIYVGAKQQTYIDQLKKPFDRNNSDRQPYDWAEDNSGLARMPVRFNQLKGIEQLELNDDRTSSKDC